MLLKGILGVLTIAPVGPSCSLRSSCGFVVGRLRGRGVQQVEGVHEAHNPYRNLRDPHLPRSCSLPERTDLTPGSEPDPPTRWKLVK